MKINEITVGAEAPQASTPWGLISKLASIMEVTLRLRNIDFDRDEAAQDAVKLMKIWVKDNTAGNNAHHALENIKMYVMQNGVFEQLKNTGDALPNFGFQPLDWFQEGLNGNAVLVQKAKGMADHIKAVTEIYDFLRLAHSAMDGTVGDEKWQSQGKFVRAVYRKLQII